MKFLGCKLVFVVKIYLRFLLSFLLLMSSHFSDFRFVWWMLWRYLGFWWTYVGDYVFRWSRVEIKKLLGNYIFYNWEEMYHIRTLQSWTVFFGECSEWRVRETISKHVQQLIKPREILAKRPGCYGALGSNFLVSFLRGSFANRMHTVARVPDFFWYSSGRRSRSRANVEARGYLGFFQAIQGSSNSCLPEATPSFSRTRYQHGDRKAFELLIALATIAISFWRTVAGLNSCRCPSRFRGPPKLGVPCVKRTSSLIFRRLTVLLEGRGVSCMQCTGWELFWCNYKWWLVRRLITGNEWK